MTVGDIVQVQACMENSWWKDREKHWPQYSDGTTGIVDGLSESDTESVYVVFPMIGRDSMRIKDLRVVGHVDA